jgi:hypothetical protein
MGGCEDNQFGVAKAQSSQVNLLHFTEFTLLNAQVTDFMPVKLDLSRLYSLSREHLASMIMHQ